MPVLPRAQLRERYTTGIWKTCRICDKPFERPPCWSKTQWGRRKYCSPECAYADYSRIRAIQWKRPQYWEMMSLAHRRSRTREYSTLHRWVRHHLGTPKRCDFCKRTEATRFHWANKSQQYREDLSDWLRLCPSCHKRYDLDAKRNQNR